MSDLPWQLPWRALQYSAENPGLQRELEKEVGPKHPLWGKNPKVIGRRIDNDDVLVHLSDGTLACVHLVWHGRIDMIPESYPSTTFFSSDEEFLAHMRQDASEYDA